MTKERSDPENSKYISDNEWMIRTSSTYEGEYKECSSIKARLHQYFIFGKTIDCSQWKRDSLNSSKWEKSRDEKAAIELINSEKARRRERLIAHAKNDVWERRSSPPENWNAPLPEHILESYKSTYLNTKAEELRGEIPRSTDATMTSLCVIM
ncbi:hypothetical protein HHI36_009213 [Cryptolaemus montrouzieri]|uniref:Synaptic plasticity regulator PANTS n=1 Tax=Cryptolaemus montrouzieri TaxID=559131 RepID=A0ABD2MVG6_9CUCU